jgi:hypothetical protein
MAKEVGLKSVKDIGKLSMFSKQLSENVKKEGLLINQFSIKDLPEDEQNRSLYYVFIDENQDKLEIRNNDDLNLIISKFNSSQSMGPNLNLYVHVDEKAFEKLNAAPNNVIIEQQKQVPDQAAIKSELDIFSPNHSAAPPK